MIYVLHNCFACLKKHVHIDTDVSEFLYVHLQFIQYYKANKTNSLKSGLRSPIQCSHNKWNGLLIFSVWLIDVWNKQAKYYASFCIEFKIIFYKKVAICSQVNSFKAFCIDSHYTQFYNKNSLTPFEGHRYIICII